MRIYLYDDQRISTGEHVDIEDLYAPVPANATHVQPPETVGDEVPHWNGKVWTVLPERPPAPESEPVPQTVTRAQGKAALIQAGLWSAVVAYVDVMTDPTDKALAEVALNDTTEWLRTSPFLNAAATTLGLSETQLDDLFRTAATIQL